MAMKALDHGVQKGLRVEPLEVEGVASLNGHTGHKRHLCATIAVTEGVNRVELRQEVGGLRRKFVGRQPRTRIHAGGERSQTIDLLSEYADRIEIRELVEMALAGSA